MNLLKKYFKLVLSVGLLVALSGGVYLSTQSPLFYVESVNIMTSKSPVVLMTQDEILNLAQVPLNQISLFTLSLKDVEKRILRSDWIERVELEKQFPSTLLVSVYFKRPVAIARGTGIDSSHLAYLSDQGKVFGELTLLQVPDLPLVSGLWDSELPENQERIQSTLKILNFSNLSGLSEVAQVASVDWSEERGFWSTLFYERGPIVSAAKKSELKNTGLILHKRTRTTLDMGQEVDDTLSSKMSEIRQVITYLKNNSLEARQIWAEVGKKVVVKKFVGS